MRALLVAMILCCAPAALAAELKQEDVADAPSEVANEMQECSAYFIVSSTCIGYQDVALANSYRQHADQLALLAFQILRTRGLSPEAYAARGGQILEGMQKATQSTCINLAALLRKYAKFCTEITRDPDPRLKQWTACKQAKRSPCPGGPA